MKKIGKINIMALLIILLCIVTIVKTRVLEVKSSINNGIIATVEDVRGDKNQCIVEVSLRKEDETAFEDGDRILIHRISSKMSDLGWDSNIDLSPDKKKLTYEFTVFPAYKGKLRRLELTLDILMQTEKEKKTLDESISDLYEAYPLAYDYEQEIFMMNKGEAADEIEAIEAETEKEVEVADKLQWYVPIEDIDNFRIIGVGFSDNYDRQVVQNETKKQLLHIRTSLIGGDQGINNEASVEGLYNMLTGETIMYIQGSTTPEINTRNKTIEEGGGIEISENYFELTNTEKLSAIKPVISYTKRKVINSGRWTLKVNVKDNVKSLSKKVDSEI